MKTLNGIFYFERDPKFSTACDFKAPKLLAFYHLGTSNCLNMSKYGTKKSFGTQLSKSMMTDKFYELNKTRA